MGIAFKSTIYATAGSYTWTAPDASVECAWADIMGAGTGGCGTASYGGSGNAGGGGSGGEFIERAFIPVVGGTIAIVVGAGTAGSAHTTSPTPAPADAGFSSAGGRIALGGRYRSVFAVNGFIGGYGGGVGGGASNTVHVASVKGNRESPLETGGWGGAQGGSRSASPSWPPLYCPGSATIAQSGTTGGGGGGATSPYGPGGTGGNDGAGHPGSASATNGAGGGGAGSCGSSSDGGLGGTGGDGKVIIYWLQAA